MRSNVFNFLTCILIAVLGCFLARDSAAETIQGLRGDGKGDEPKRSKRRLIIPAETYIFLVASIV